MGFAAVNRLLPYFGGLLVALLATMVCTHARAEVRVPVQLQAQLVSRLGTFDRNFKTRAGSLARVLVVRRAGNGESKSVGAIFARALVELGQVGGVPASVEEIDYPDPTTLATRCRTSQVALVYFSVGLEPEMRAVASALVGVDVLTVGALGSTRDQRSSGGLRPRRGPTEDRAQSKKRTCPECRIQGGAPQARTHCRIAAP